MKTKFVILCLCASTFLLGLCAVRQRAWALSLRDQLSVTNKDDVKLMQSLSTKELRGLRDKFREQGETRVADWIDQQYLAPQEAGL